MGRGDRSKVCLMDAHARQVPTLPRCRWHGGASVLLQFHQPIGGWSAATKAAARRFGRLGSDRKGLLQTRARLALRLPTPQPRPREWFKWSRALLGDFPEQAAWNLDWSLVHRRWRQFRASIVVMVGLDVVLYCQGIPRHWRDVAAAVAAWDLFIAFLDCLPAKHANILFGQSRSGGADGSYQNTTTARIWRMIGATLDGNLETSADDERVLWMLAASAINGHWHQVAFEWQVADWRWRLESPGRRTWRACRCDQRGPRATSLCCSSRRKRRYCMLAHSLGEIPQRPTTTAPRRSW